MSIAVAVSCLLGFQSAPLPDPKWELAFDRGPDVWTANADGSHQRRLIRKASHPHWSRDGRKLAFTRGSDVWVFDLATHKERRVTRFRGAVERSPYWREIYADWDPSRPVLLCATITTESIRMIRFDSAKNGGEILSGVVNMPTYAPAWSPSGNNLAYVRAGDIWIAKRYKDTMGAEADMPKGWYNAGTYYEDARRLAPLAVFNDNEKGVSAITPYWVDELAWTRDEKRLVFHFRRIGGSGVAEIGYLDLKPVPKTEDEPEDWSQWSGYTYELHWILDDVWSPRICPDGKTLSYTAYDENSSVSRLYLNAWDGKHERKLFADVQDPDWRPRR